MQFKLEYVTSMDRVFIKFVIHITSNTYQQWIMNVRTLVATLTKLESYHFTRHFLCKCYFPTKTQPKSYTIPRKLILVTPNIQNASSSSSRMSPSPFSTFKAPILCLALWTVNCRVYHIKDALHETYMLSLHKCSTPIPLYDDIHF